MSEMLKTDIRVLTHSAIRLSGEKTVYIDPFHLEEAPRDGEIIFITHDHHDHFSPEDIRRAAREDALLVMPEAVLQKALEAGFSRERILTAAPAAVSEAAGVPFEAVPAYNIGKPFHERGKGYVGYVITLCGERIYIAGDCDADPENEALSCDAALLPVGGTYTMTAPEAAAFAKKLRPRLAVPTHCGDIVGSPEDAAAFCRLLQGSVPTALCRK